MLTYMQQIGPSEFRDTPLHLYNTVRGLSASGWIPVDPKAFLVFSLE